MSYAAPKPIWPPAQRPMNNNGESPSYTCSALPTHPDETANRVGTPPASQPIDNVEHNTAYNPFEDGPIRRKARESTESFNSAIDEDIYSQQTFKYV